MNAPKMRILIVDDEPLARERLASLIRELGIGEVVGEAGNGIEALTAVAAHAPQLVLLDIRMPGMDGLEVAQHLTYYEPPRRSSLRRPTETTRSMPSKLVPSIIC
jgi:two-component system, LytTR family, response regulator AlgR